MHSHTLSMNPLRHTNLIWEHLAKDPIVIPARKIRMPDFGEIDIFCAYFTYSSQKCSLSRNVMQ